MTLAQRTCLICSLEEEQGLLPLPWEEAVEIPLVVSNMWRGYIYPRSNGCGFTLLHLTGFFSTFDDGEHITHTRRRRGFTDGDRIYFHRQHRHGHQQQQQPVVGSHDVW